MAVKRDISVEKTATYKGHKGAIFSMVLDEANQKLYSGGDDGVVAAWDINSQTDDGKGLLKIGRSIYALHLLSGHELLAAGSSDGTLYLLDPAKNKLVREVRKTSLAIYNIHYDPGTDYLYVLFAKGALGIYHVSSFKEIFFQQLSTEHLRSIVQTGNDIIIGSSDGHIRILNANDLTEKRAWEAHDNSVFSLSYHHDGKYLISGGRDAHLNVWDQQSDMERIHHIPAHNFTVNDIAFSPDSDYIATASRDKTFKIWDAYNLQLLKVIDHVRYDSHVHSVNKVKWMKYAKYSLFSCSDDRMIHRWLLRINT